MAQARRARGERVAAERARARHADRAAVRLRPVRRGRPRRVELRARRAAAGRELRGHEPVRRRLERPHRAAADGVDEAHGRALRDHQRVGDSAAFCRTWSRLSKTLQNSPTVICPAGRCRLPSSTRGSTFVAMYAPASRPEARGRLVDDEGQFVSDSSDDGAERAARCGADRGAPSAPIARARRPIDLPTRTSRAGSTTRAARGGVHAGRRARAPPSPTRRIHSAPPRECCGRESASPERAARARARAAHRRGAAPALAAARGRRRRGGARRRRGARRRARPPRARRAAGAAAGGAAGGAAPAALLVQRSLSPAATQRRSPAPMRSPRAHGVKLVRLPPKRGGSLPQLGEPSRRSARDGGGDERARNRSRAAADADRRARARRRRAAPTGGPPRPSRRRARPAKTRRAAAARARRGRARVRRRRAALVARPRRPRAPPRARRRRRSARGGRSAAQRRVRQQLRPRGRRGPAAPPRYLWLRPDGEVVLGRGCAPPLSPPSPLSPLR